ncbi:MAG TPA: hypothetical protein VHT52_10840 [Stellaceae bacterium]|jgi:hypothetical protein|nr:hypothetical protein [Stellaceae bacterium]
MPTTNSPTNPGGHPLANQRPLQQDFVNREYIHRAAWKTGVLGALNVATKILAVRLILLVGVLGATGLTYLALHDPDPYRLAALGVYAAVVVVPLIWLASR